MSFYLKILSSPGGGRDGQLIDLPEGDSMAGRTSPPSKIWLDGPKVSKKHCVFKQSGSELQVSDLRSANGLFVNGKRLESAMLKVRDRVVVGDFVLEVGGGSATDAMNAKSAAGATSIKSAAGATSIKSAAGAKAGKKS